MEIKTVKRTVKRSITSREGLCPQTQSDDWMHEDVLEAEIIKENQMENGRDKE